jgi:pyruvate formate lyase activating enzyme
MERTDKETGIIFNIKRFSVHDGPGIRTSIFLKGCPLNCIWCHNPEGISRDITIWYNMNICITCGLCVGECPNSALTMNKSLKKYVEINRSRCTLAGKCVKICPTGAIQFTGTIASIGEIMDEIRKDLVFFKTSGGGVTITGGEPLFQPEFCYGILKACKTEGISTAIETSLFCDRDVLEAMMNVVDMFIVDMKIFDTAKHEQYTGKPNHIIKENIRFLVESGKDIKVRMPLIPGITDSPANIEEIVGFVNSLNPEWPIEYLNYNLLTKSKYQRLAIPYSLE